METIKKAIFIVSAVLCLNLSTFAQDISLTINNVTIKEAIERIKKESGYSFIFSSMDLDTKARVSLSLEN